MVLIFSELFLEFKHIFREYAALKAVNKEMVGLYWNIGRMVGERQLRRELKNKAASRP